MKYAMLLFIIIIAGCTIARVDTLKNCSMEAEAFLTIQYWTIIDCTDIEDHRLDEQTKAEELIQGKD
mgnify:CR=1 FL=1